MSEPIDRITIEAEFNDNASDGLKKLEQTLKSLGTAGKSASSSQLDKLKSVGDTLAKPLGNVAYLLGVIGKASSKLGLLMLKPFQRVATSVQDGAKRLSTFLSSIKRIAMYRAIRFVLSQITQAFKEGTEAVYRYSDTIGGKFASSMDQSHTASQYFKNSIGAMIAPLINALAPAIDFIIDKIVALINVLNQLFARLSGASTWTRAIKQSAKFGDTLAGAGGAAKELKKTVMGFDELNLLNDNSSGGGGGSANKDYGSMFEEVPIDNKISSFADRLKVAFTSGDWDSLGSILGEKFNSVVDSIKWGSIGSKIGYYLNGIITTSYSFLDTSNFTSLGEKLSAVFNNFFGQVDFGTAGALFVTKFTSLFDLIAGFISRLDTTLLGSSVGGFIRGAFDTASTWLDSFDFAEFAQTLQEKIRGYFEGLDIEETAEGIGTFLGELLYAGIEFVANIDWVQAFEDVWNGVTEGLEGFFSGLSEGLDDSDAFSTTLSGISDALSDIFSVLRGETSLKDFINNLSAGQIILVSFVTAIAAVSAALAIATAATTAFSTVMALVTSPVTLVIAAITALIAIGIALYQNWDEIKAKASEIWEKINSSITGFVDKIKTKVVDTFENIRSKVVEKVDALRQKIHDIFEKIKTTVSNAVEKLKNFFSFDWELPKIKLPHFSITGEFSLNPPSIPKIGVDWYANGGFPDAGELFVAREAGAELVGNIGGKTTVANNEQIVAGISEGVRGANEDVVSAVLAAAQQIVQTIRDKDTATYLDGEKVSKSVTNKQNRNSRMYGRPVLNV